MERVKGSAVASFLRKEGKGAAKGTAKKTVGTMNLSPKQFVQSYLDPQKRKTWDSCFNDGFVVQTIDGIDQCLRSPAPAEEREEQELIERHPSTSEGGNQAGAAGEELEAGWQVVRDKAPLATGGAIGGATGGTTGGATGSITGLNIRHNLKKALSSRSLDEDPSVPAASPPSGSSVTSLTGLHIRDNLKKVLRVSSSSGVQHIRESLASSAASKGYPVSRLKHESEQDAKLNCTRIVYYTFETPNPFSRPRESLVFQDHFTDEDTGAETVYEISVEHAALPTTAKGHVRAMLYLNAHVARPATEATTGSMQDPARGASVVTSVLMMKLKGSNVGRLISKRAMATSPAAGFSRMKSGSAGGGVGSPRFEQDKQAAQAQSERGDAAESTFETPTVSIDDFELMAVVGRGGFGKVMQVLHKETGGVYAMKVLRKRELAKRKQIERTKVERSILAEVQHPFIVSLHFAFQTDQKLYMVLDFVQGGDFRTLLQAQRKFSEKRVQLYTAEMCLALDHLHK
jgi:hypothetical protein